MFRPRLRRGSLLASRGDEGRHSARTRTRRVMRRLCSRAHQGKSANSPPCGRYPASSQGRAVLGRHNIRGICPNDHKFILIERAGGFQQFMLSSGQFQTQQNRHYEGRFVRHHAELMDGCPYGSGDPTGNQAVLFTALEAKSEGGYPAPAEVRPGHRTRATQVSPNSQNTAAPAQVCLPTEAQRT